MGSLPLLYFLSVTVASFVARVAPVLSPSTSILVAQGTCAAQGGMARRERARSSCPHFAPRQAGLSLAPSGWSRPANRRQLTRKDITNRVMLLACAMLGLKTLFVIRSKTLLWIERLVLARLVVNAAPLCKRTTPICALEAPPAPSKRFICSVSR